MIKKSGDHGLALAAVSGDMLEVVTFFAGGQRCAMEARQVRASRPLHGDDWESYPAIDSLLGLEEGDKIRTPRQVLTIRLPEADVELSVATPVQLRELKLDAIHPLPDLVAARTRLRGLHALALDEEGLTLIFDLRDLSLRAEDSRTQV
ncbi:MAG: hypothetical protein ABFE02_12830 [Sulfuricella sp.]